MGEYDGLLAFDRMERAVAKVRERLLRSTNALEMAEIPYAVVGGSAVMAWVQKIDESAMRPTPDVDIVIRRSDFDRAKSALVAVGFFHRNSAGAELFFDGPGAKSRDAARFFFG